MSMLMRVAKLVNYNKFNSFNLAKPIVSGQACKRYMQGSSAASSVVTYLLSTGNSLAKNASVTELYCRSFTFFLPLQHLRISTPALQVSLLLLVCVTIVELNIPELHTPFAVTSGDDNRQTAVNNIITVGFIK
jgi:hypothetical protein